MSGVERFFGSSNPPAASPTASPIKPLPPQPKASFDVAVEFTLKNEGGYSDDPHDSGGATNFGITENDLAQYLGRPATVQEVKEMSIDTAKAIYKRNYWISGFEGLFQGAATAIFDFGVLHGPTTARTLAQSTANVHGGVPHLLIDGQIGPQTQAAINAMGAPFVAYYASAMRNVFVSIVANNPSQGIFLKGWDNRADKVAALA